MPSAAASVHLCEPVGHADAAATLAHWRAQGQDALDPIRFRFLEALVRRSAGQQGEARRLLDARVAQLLAVYARDLAQRPAACEEREGPATRGPLGALVAGLARPAAPPAADAPQGSTPGASSTPELPALDFFRSTWSRLRTERRLTQALAQVPENAGPLNSHQLVHRSLRLMRELSPAYLQRFVSYVDALQWLEHTQAASAPAPQAEPRPRKRAAARGKAA